jgi:hypothetical protein
MAQVISCDVKGCTETGIEWPDYARYSLRDDEFYLCKIHAEQAGRQILKYLRRCRDVGMKLIEEPALNNDTPE